jgi:hypothetical protein
MKQSEAIRELLAAYHFQHGRSVSGSVVDKARKVINMLEKREKSK